MNAEHVRPFISRNCYFLRHVGDQLGPTVQDGCLPPLRAIGRQEVMHLVVDAAYPLELEAGPIHEDVIRNF
jgi:hypothetical protein